MKHIHTFESFLNEAKKSSNVITIRKFLSKDHNALWKWMQKEFGPGKYSPGLQRIAGPLTHGGDFTLDVSNWDEKDIETLKAYLSSQNHVFESFLNEAYKPVPPTMKISGKFTIKVGNDNPFEMLIAGFERNDDTTDSLYFMDTDDDKRIKWGSFVVKNADMPKLSKGQEVKATTSKGNLPVKLKRIGDL
jgi:hypothetical protein